MTKCPFAVKTNEYKYTLKININPIKRIYKKLR